MGINEDILLLLGVNINPQTPAEIARFQNYMARIPQIFDKTEKQLAATKARINKIMDFGKEHSTMRGWAIAGGASMVTGSPTPLIIHGMMKGVQTTFKLGMSMVKDSIEMTRTIMSSMFSSFFAKFTAFTATIFSIGQAVDAVKIANQDLVGRFKSAFILKDQADSAMPLSDIRFERILDKFVESTTFSRNDLREVVNQARLLGMPMKEILGTLLPLSADLAAARGKPIENTANAILYDLRYGLQDEFRRMTGASTISGEDPVARNRRHLERLMAFTGQAMLLARRDILGKMEQMWGQAKLVVGSGLLELFRPLLEKMTDVFSTIAAFRGLSTGAYRYVGDDPAKRGFIGRDQYKQLDKNEKSNFFEIGYFERIMMRVTRPLTAFFTGFTTDNLVEKITNILVRIAVTLFNFSMAFQATKWMVLFKIIPVALMTIWDALKMQLTYFFHLGLAAILSIFSKDKATEQLNLAAAAQTTGVDSISKRIGKKMPDLLSDTPLEAFMRAVVRGNDGLRIFGDQLGMLIADFKEVQARRTKGGSIYNLDKRGKPVFEQVTPDATQTSDIWGQGHYQRGYSGYRATESKRGGTTAGTGASHLPWQRPQNNVPFRPTRGYTNNPQFRPARV